MVAKLQQFQLALSRIDPTPSLLGLTPFAEHFFQKFSKQVNFLFVNYIFFFLSSNVHSELRKFSYHLRMDLDNKGFNAENF